MQPVDRDQQHKRLLWLFSRLSREPVTAPDDEAGPPWFESGVNQPVGEGVYAHCRNRVSKLWLHGKMFLSGEEPSTWRLFWCVGTQCFGRELTVDEQRLVGQVLANNEPGGPTTDSSRQPVIPLGPIRLGCLHCDRNDYDSVTELPRDWLDIERVQSFVESIRTDDSGENVLLWQTHLGACPNCRARYGEGTA